MKIIHNTFTGQLSDYPRTDGEPVIGLDPSLRILDRVDEAVPEFDPAVQRLAANNRAEGESYIYGWQLLDLTPEEIAARLPSIVTNWQFKQALIAAMGILPDDIAGMLSAIPDPIDRAKALVDWSNAETVRRDHPLIPVIASQLGKTDAEIDQLFAYAATL